MHTHSESVRAKFRTEAHKHLTVTSRYAHTYHYKPGLRQYVGYATSTSFNISAKHIPLTWYDRFASWIHLMLAKVSFSFFFFFLKVSLYEGLWLPSRIARHLLLLLCFDSLCPFVHRRYATHVACGSRRDCHCVCLRRCRRPNLSVGQRSAYALSFIRWQGWK
jgi:hypothetical protein